MKTNLEKWIQFEPNPFIIFSKDGRILYCNEAGEYLLSFINPKSIFQQILELAPNEIGFKFAYQKFEFDTFHYDYALIGYDNYEEIGVKFYQNIKLSQKIDLKIEEINIYFLIDFVRTYVFIDKEIKFIDLFDVDLPPIYFDKDKLIKILIAIYQMLKNNKEILTEIKLKIGEYLKIENRKHQILSITLSAENINYQEIEEKTDLCSLHNNLIDIRKKENKIIILIPILEH